MALLQINNLTVEVAENNAKRCLLDRINFSMDALSIVSLVGESGSGKTTTGLAVLRLLSPGLAITNGNVIFNNQDLLALPEDKMRGIRGRHIGMVFQEPLNAFNPVFSIGYQISEVLEVHTEFSAKQRRQRVLDLLDMVELPNPRQIVESFPHQLSGGMRQRAMIAQAIAANPQLIIADEPTSNLDVTLQAKIMELFRKLRKELNLSILLITHDLGLVAHLADQVVVMHSGKIVETGKANEVLANPQQAYTQQLLEASGV